VTVRGGVYSHSVEGLSCRQVTVDYFSVGVAEFVWYEQGVRSFPALAVEGGFRE